MTRYLGLTPLDGYTHIGTTLPGPPGPVVDRLGIATHHTLNYGLELCRSGEALHLWHGDWLKHSYEIYQCSRSATYLAIAVSLVG